MPSLTPSTVPSTVPSLVPSNVPTTVLTPRLPFPYFPGGGGGRGRRKRKRRVKRASQYQASLAGAIYKIKRKKGKTLTGLEIRGI